MYVHVKLSHSSLCAAQNNSFVDERTAQEMCHTPTDSVPPLMELSARAVLNHGVAWDSVPLPICLRGEYSCVVPRNNIMVATV